MTRKKREHDDVRDVRGVPCVVLERGVEIGVLCRDDGTEPDEGHPLYVAPDGMLFTLCGGPGECWFSGHPRGYVERRLRRIAKEM